MIWWRGLSWPRVGRWKASGSSPSLLPSIVRRGSFASVAQRSSKRVLARKISLWSAAPSRAAPSQRARNSAAGRRSPEAAGHGRAETRSLGDSAPSRKRSTPTRGAPCRRLSSARPTAPATASRPPSSGISTRWKRSPTRWICSSRLSSSWLSNFRYMKTLRMKTGTPIRSRGWTTAAPTRQAPSCQSMAAAPNATASQPPVTSSQQLRRTPSAAASAMAPLGPGQPSSGP
mmetsp:Transcript_41973/g.112629  ORF Transcript_41973/g.112629 Transcript_41973/m.112629 type:complete len:231 (-) Transcript_41973:240-932(-)